MNYNIIFKFCKPPKYNKIRFFEILEIFVNYQSIVKNKTIEGLPINLLVFLVVNVLMELVRSIINTRVWNPKLKLATLFSGIGAVEQALIRMHKDYEIVFACDNGEIEVDVEEEKIKQEVFSMNSKIEKKTFVDGLYSSKSRKQNYVKQSYLANYDIDEEDFHLDIRFLDGRDYEGQVDLLVGGSPCQSFSTVGFQGGLDDTRGTLFYEYARIIQEVRPKVFIFENVRGLTTHDNGKTWAKIRDVFMNTLHYNITEPQVLNAADYGIPQTRRRLFVVGIRDDIDVADFEYPVPLGVDNLEYCMQDFLEDNCAFDPVNYNFYYDEEGSLVVNNVVGVVDPKYTLTPKVRDYVLASGTKGFKTSTLAVSLTRILKICIRIQPSLMWICEQRRKTGQSVWASR